MTEWRRFLARLSTEDWQSNLTLRESLFAEYARLAREHSTVPEMPAAFMSAMFDLKHFEIEHVGRRDVPRFGIVGESYTMRFKNIEACEDLNALLREAFTELIERAFRGAGPDDLVGFSFDSSFLTKGRIVSPFLKRRELSVEWLIRLIESLLQSYEEMVLTDLSHIDCVRVENFRENL